MTYQIRHYIAFDGEIFDIESTMDFVRHLLATDGIEPDIYQAVFSTLVELRAGYPYEDSDLINGLEVGYVTIRQFFENWGTGTVGGAHTPIDLTVEDEIEEQDVYITIDVEAQGDFFNEIEALDIMNDDIGEFDGSITFDLDGNTIETVDSDYTLGSEDSYSM
jgi:hypothetical protein